MARLLLRDWTHPQGTFQPINVDDHPGQECRYGGRGQLLTHDFDELQTWARAQPPSDGVRLRCFVQACVELAAALPARRIANRNPSSYGLKHYVEAVVLPLRHEYVSNEELVVALIQAGFRAINTNARHTYPGPNYFFNLPSALFNRVKAAGERTATKKYCDPQCLVSAHATQIYARSLETA